MRTTLKHRLAAVAAIALGLGLAIGAPALSASAHTPSITASCSGVVLTASNYDGTKVNTWTATVAGVTSSGTFGASLSHTITVPQEGATSAWSATIQAFDGSYASTQSGNVGPCGTPPADANPHAVIATTCGAAVITVTNPLDGEAAREDALVKVYLDGVVYKSVTVTADHAARILLSVAEDSGTHHVIVRTGPLVNGTVLATATLASDCKPAVVNTPPKHTTGTPAVHHAVTPVASVHKLAYTGTPESIMLIELGLGLGAVLIGIAGMLYVKWRRNRPQYRRTVK